MSSEQKGSGIEISGEFCVHLTEEQAKTITGPESQVGPYHYNALQSLTVWAKEDGILGLSKDEVRFFAAVSEAALVAMDDLALKKAMRGFCDADIPS